MTQGKTTNVSIEVVSSDEGHRAVVYFDGKEVVGTANFPDKDVAMMWARHLETVGRPFMSGVRT